MDSISKYKYQQVLLIDDRKYMSLKVSQLRSLFDAVTQDCRGMQMKKILLVFTLVVVNYS